MSTREAKQSTSVRLSSADKNFLSRHRLPISTQLEGDISLLRGLLDLLVDKDTKAWTLDQAVKFVAKLVRHQGS
jgi:hypothetical protein